MFEFLTHGSSDAINLIKKDHENVKDLFEKFEKAENVHEKRKIAADTIMELKLHAAIEEEIFYAVVRKKIEKKIMNEADEEHHVVKLLISELEQMDGTEDHYEAKYKVLSENVRHHIKEEESDMLSKARALDIDYNALGEQIEARKAELKKTGVPTFAEETTVAKRSVKGDSPAAAAKITKRAPKGKASPAKARKPSKIVKFPKKPAAKTKPARKTAAAKITGTATKKAALKSKPANVKKRAGKR